MLVLSRKAEEKVLIELPGGYVATVMVIEIRGDKTRLGFDFPKELQVHREEVYRAIQREKAGETRPPRPVKGERT